MHYKVSKVGKTGKPVEYGAVVADRFEVVTIGKRFIDDIEGVYFYRSSESWWRSRVETLSAFFPGKDWIVEVE